MEKTDHKKIFIHNKCHLIELNKKKIGEFLMLFNDEFSRVLDDRVQATLIKNITRDSPEKISIFRQIYVPIYRNDILSSIII